MLLLALLVDVGPVEDLILGELAVGDRPKRGSRQVQVVAAGQAEVVLGDRLLRLLGLGDLRLGRVVELAGRVAPRPEVVLVEDDGVPLDEVNDLVVL